MSALFVQKSFEQNTANGDTNEIHVGKGTILPGHHQVCVDITPDSATQVDVTLMGRAYDGGPAYALASVVNISSFTSPTIVSSAVRASSVWLTVAWTGGGGSRTLDAHYTGTPA